MTRKFRRVLSRALGGVLGWLVAAEVPPGRAAGEEMAIVAKVDGEPVELGEFWLHLNAQRAGVYAHFQSRTRVEDTDRFWQTKYDGVTPADFLKAKTLQVLKEIKVQQSAARRAGIVDDARYAAFRRRWEAENARRAAAPRTGDVIYGPKHLSEWVFYNEEMARLVRLLKRDAEDKTLQVSEDEVRQYYERHKNERYHAREGGFVSYEVLASAVRRDCVEEKYRAMVEELVARAEVVVNRSVYEGIDPTVQRRPGVVSPQAASHGAAAPSPTPARLRPAYARSDSALSASPKWSVLRPMRSISAMCRRQSLRFSSPE
ncbi:MAG: hypothetical protein ABJF10_26235 [Chthoniobacter sp.]|uniref:hypothetical protein n=1 Tax=Chthoniobacter sp. TaxID=2510640 RepID=UPI0032AC824C